MPELGSEEDKSSLKEPSKFNSSIWLLGNQEACLKISSCMAEESIECVSRQYNSALYPGSPSDLQLSSVDAKQSTIKLVDEIFNAGKTLGSGYLSKSPLSYKPVPTHLEFHCQSFFALYKEHPS